MGGDFCWECGGGVGVYVWLVYCVGVGCECGDVYG